MVSDTATAVVLLSGGMDSTVALFWALQTYAPVHTLSINYGQRHRLELTAVNLILQSPALRGHSRLGEHQTVAIPKRLFSTSASILDGGAAVATYRDVEEAVQKTESDPSYLPLRNAIFISIAAHWLVGHWSPQGGVVITGARGRTGPGGFPDCTLEFHKKMGEALRTGLNKDLKVISPLNQLPEVSRSGTIHYASTIPGCLETLAYTLTCFQGFEPPCGHCLPCLRREQAFKEAGIEDPLSRRLRESC